MGLIKGWGKFMWAFHDFTGKCIVIGGLLTLSACTGVSFTPTTDKVTPAGSTLSSNIPGTTQEQFLFDKNTGRAKVDVLIIDDNSGSMQNKQPLLASRLSSFVSSLGNIDWQLGITTQDVSNGPYGLKGSLLTMQGTSSYILNDTVPNYETVFANTIVRTEIGSGDERPDQAIIDAIAKRDLGNAGFFRDGADLAILILSDEDESADNGVPPAISSDVLMAFRQAFGQSKNITVYAIQVIPGDTACFTAQLPYGSNYGYIHAQLVQDTGGVMGSICDADYGPTLTSIGDRVQSLAQKSVLLSRDPVPGSVTVVTIPLDPGLTFTVNGRTVYFNKTPALGTRVEVNYTPL